MCKECNFGLYCLKNNHARNVMETFDYIIIGLGIALIVIGLFLFISGKRDSLNGNQVEGFGIKLNVSNPSIILIVFGIGLVLFPKLMLNNSPINSGETKPAWIEDDNPGENVDKPGSGQQPALPAPQPSSATVFFPKGTWYLNQYEENGIDLTSNIKGSIRFNQRNNSSQDWYAEMIAVDGWGNVMNYNYTGIINALPGGYNIDTRSSNDPSFFRQQPSQLAMKMDNPNSLHMEYMFNGSSILIHWSQ